jgi:hypothetical protein
MAAGKHRAGLGSRRLPAFAAQSAAGAIGAGAADRADDGSRDTRLSFRRGSANDTTPAGHFRDCSRIAAHILRTSWLYRAANASRARRTSSTIGSFIGCVPHDVFGCAEDRTTKSECFARRVDALSQNRIREMSAVPGQQELHFVDRGYCDVRCIGLGVAGQAAVFEQFLDECRRRNSSVPAPAAGEITRNRRIEVELGAEYILRWRLCDLILSIQKRC